MIPEGITPFDLHVLGTPPAFVLSQDQTLKKLYLKHFRASNHFLNNRFWQLTQEFSLAVFAYASNKSINLSKVFCSSLRYSIYKVQSLSALAVSLLILARRLPFVKNFFQVFSNFLSRGTRSRIACVFYRIEVCLSRGF